MEQTVYIDLYVIVNFSMDLLCLLITAALLHHRASRLRVLLASVLGGLYAAAALLLSFGGVIGFLLDALVAAFLCTVAFWNRGTGLRRILKSTLLLLLVSSILGGVMTALYYGLNKLNLPFEALQGDGLSVWIFALLSAVAGIATLRGGALMGLSRKTRALTVSATLFETELTLCAMVDTGNLLRDPVSGIPVIVADRTRALKMLPPEAAALFDLSDPTKALERSPHQLRLIPSNSAGGSALLLAVKPDRLTLTDKSTTYPAAYLIAFAELGDSAQGFDALIGAD